MSTLHPSEDSAYDHRLFVAAATAADVIERRIAPAPTVLIVDAERAEAEVLRGFAGQLAAPQLRAIVFEAPNAFLETRAPADLHALLASAGFTLRILARQERTGHELSNFVAERA